MIKNEIKTMKEIKKNYTAKSADKHILYQEAVQNVEYEVDMLQHFYRKYNKKLARSLKEDFCGTFSLSCEWVKRNKENTAIGVDLDKKTLNWGRKNNLAKLDDKQKERVQLEFANVLDIVKPKVDIVGASNFSYWIFSTTQELEKYFSQAYKSLKSDGILVLDAFGGPAAEREQEEVRKCNGFYYIWEQVYFYPGTRKMGCKIHFRFKDGSEMDSAFTYSWRLWTPPEITTLLKLVGFREIHWYWEGTDEETGEGNGVYRKSKNGETAETWMAYAIALK